MMALRCKRELAETSTSNYILNTHINDNFDEHTNFLLSFLIFAGEGSVLKFSEVVLPMRFKPDARIIVCGKST